MLRKPPDNYLNGKQQKVRRKMVPSEPMDWIRSMRKRKRLMQSSRRQNKRRKVSADREGVVSGKEEEDASDESDEIPDAQTQSIVSSQSENVEFVETDPKAEADEPMDVDGRHLTVDHKVCQFDFAQ